MKYVSLYPHLYDLPEDFVFDPDAAPTLSHDDVDDMISDSFSDCAQVIQSQGVSEVEQIIAMVRERLEAQERYHGASFFLRSRWEEQLEGPHPILQWELGGYAASYADTGEGCIYHRASGAVWCFSREEIVSDFDDSLDTIQALTIRHTVLLSVLDAYIRYGTVGDLINHRPRRGPEGGSLRVQGNKSYRYRHSERRAEIADAFEHFRQNHPADDQAATLRRVQVWYSSEFDQKDREKYGRDPEPISPATIRRAIGL